MLRTPLNINLKKNSLLQLQRRIMSSSAEPSVLFTVKDTARIITLNRPKKLNALNTEMCSLMFNTLSEYSKSGLTDLIILKSSNSPRSFCAGGDVAAVALNNIENPEKIADSVNFFKSEYSLNALLATFNKPIVSIMDGITMGGGVGLSIHTPFRISTENTKWAMPEMDIGFFPDVGVSFALPRTIGLANSMSQMSLYLCLTGDLLNGIDTYILGLASHYVPHENLAELEKRLSEIHQNSIVNKEEYTLDIINETIKEFTTPIPSEYNFKFTDDQLLVIETCFKIHEIQTHSDIIKKLDSFEGSENARIFAKDIKEKLLTKSKTSMDVAIRLIQENSRDNIVSALRRDLCTAVNMCFNADQYCEFSSATKHKLVDKQKTLYPWKQTKDLSISQITSIVSPKPSMDTGLLKNSINTTLVDYPYHLRYQLPTETKIKDYIYNNNITEQANVIDYFANINEQTKDKSGIKLYCESIFKRKCAFQDSKIEWKL
ncbi:hypothetical protein KAFR_0A01030 [Kazachstania africana CBS 2517]|uniref:3-hydroxyisobutyryl-CoA hydrolase n=1 Tax=Kazachstania africana (strain ATCC 22294 / BCRC 22015 / CBS 2517 / CECT 1963 / NBRC 1671 / NRRL Y-8276) TaxID=1071382 RepID=H2AME2_KAZAF|nr:hypothetical protein KAFR_0A01030 [Kazachstania africana CBS 2517]CCF55542.1 hypothetical protein KAFR_0A01030 [Kazachstania africana CBS 2517]